MWTRLLNRRHFARGAAIFTVSYVGLHTARAHAGNDATQLSLFSHGNNFYGQLGLGDDSKDHYKPTEISFGGSVDLAKVYAGPYSAIVLTKDGTVYSFGRGDSYVLGQGNNSSYNYPTVVSGLQQITDVSVSNRAALAVDAAGTIWSWGSRSNPALGREGSKLHNVPRQVDFTAPTAFTHVSVGTTHALALDKDGRAYAWGSGDTGAIGNASRDPALKVAPIAALASTPIAQVAAGSNFSLFLTKEGRVLSCGKSDYGETGQIQRYERIPSVIAPLAREKVVSIACGTHHAAAVTDQGEVYVWGLGKDGQLGNGQSIVRNPVPKRVEALIGKKVKTVVCGSGHTAALTEDGKLFAWGRGRDGQLGRYGEHVESVAAARLEPVELDFYDKHGMRVEQISLGNDYTMALARRK